MGRGISKRGAVYASAAQPRPQISSSVVPDTGSHVLFPMCPPKPLLSGLPALCTDPTSKTEQPA